MQTYSELRAFFDQHDDILSMSMNLLADKHGTAVEPYAHDILTFLSHRGVDSPAVKYLEANQALMQMAEDFRQTGRYPASCYAEVRPIDRELYNLRLPLSFIVTNHRFEILQHLVGFLQHERSGPKELLSVGVGTGYEVKVAHDVLNHSQEWQINAFDNSSDFIAFTRDLLAFFGYPTTSVHEATFPLEHAEGLEPYENRFSKIILCEVLEHLEQPAEAIRNLSRALHPNGQMFLTMAINMPQEDHIFLYSTIAQARQQVTDLGLHVVWEFVTPATIMPFDDDQRGEILRAGNYLCIVEK